MLVLTRDTDAYPDDGDRSIRYRVPIGLRPLPAPDGTPQAVLSRSADGGLLHLRLEAMWPALQSGERTVAFHSGRFRLVPRTPSATDTGQWWPSPVTGAAVVDRSVSLDAVEAAIARRVGARDGNLVDVEVELSLNGLAPSFPWLASVDRASLRARVAALLRSTPASAEEIEAAFLGLPPDMFTWHPLECRAMPPPRDDALRAIAYAALRELFVANAGGYTLAEDGPPRYDVSLAVPRMQTRNVGLRWSFSEFLAAQPDPGKHLIDVAIPAPFVAADLCVVNDVPLAANGITGIAVEIRTGGPTGVVQHQFNPGEPSAKRLRFVRETADPLNIKWRARTAVVTANGPAMVDSDEHASGLLVEINPATLGLRALRFAARPDVFDHVTTLEIALGTRVLVLSAAAPEAWAVGRQAPASVTVTATRAAGERYPLGAIEVGPTGLLFDASALGVGEYVSVSLRPPADLDQRAAYLGIQVEGQAWRTVEGGGDIVLSVRRANRFAAPNVKYRSRVVPRRADGATSAVSESTWREAAGEIVTLEL